MTQYSSRAEALYRQVVEPIEASGVVEDATSEYDVEAILDELLPGTVSVGYEVPAVDPDVFWSVVERHARPSVPLR